MSSAELKISRESFASLRPEISPLLWDHQQERRVDVGLPGEPDEETLLAMEKVGCLLLFSGRKGEELAGYIFWVLQPTNIEYARQATALQGPWYVKPEERNSCLGLSLLRHSIRELRSRGFALLDLHHFGEPRLGSLFEGMGAKATTTHYLLNLKERG